MAGQQADRQSVGRRVCVGAFAGARGLNGDVWVKSFTAAPEDVAAYGPVSDAAGVRRFTLNVVGHGSGGVIARIDGIADRTAAEAVKGIELFVDRAALPAPAEDEFYFADLIGLMAERADEQDEAARPIGRVDAVHDFGAGAVLEIALAQGGVAMVPFTREAVPAVDLARGRLLIAPLPGLLAPAVDGESGDG
ncbi:MAG: ribosome maturation factor RimM [Defluviicoccus sp.]|nr:ribosome maturation factor RimM [Defluviicoccus sp.]MDG4591113.1 ribosome maturation factor RimM [Defluviicoccus sp.]